MSSSSLPAVLAWHCQRYPLLRAQDIYKLVQQGVFGPGHMISSAAAAKSALAAEVRSQSVECRRQNYRAEELIEEIDPRGKLVRVNLRPMLRIRDEGGKRKVGKGGADAEWLVGAMVESAGRVEGDPEQMRRRLAAAVRWCRKNLPRQAAELDRMAVRAEESGYPAFHHSPAYARAYRPAYRVVLRTCVRKG